MSNTRPFPPIDRLTAHGSGGCTLDQLASATYDLSQSLGGIPVDFVHGGRRYQTLIAVHALPPEPPPDSQTIRQPVKARHVVDEIGCMYCGGLVRHNPNCQAQKEGRFVMAGQPVARTEPASADDQPEKSVKTGPNRAARQNNT